MKYYFKCKICGDEMLTDIPKYSCDKHKLDNCMLIDLEYHLGKGLNSLDELNDYFIKDYYLYKT